MKKILWTIFVLMSYQASAQTYALLDRRWYKPAQFKDSISRNDLSDGWFPIYKNELDTLIMLVSKLKDIKRDGFDRKFYYAPDFKSNNISFQIENIKRAYGDGYEINLKSDTEFGSNTLKLSDPAIKLTANQANIRAFLAYLKITRKNIDKPKKGKKSNQFTG